MLHHYKVGDKVVITTSGSLYYNEICEVIEISGANYRSYMLKRDDSFTKEGLHFWATYANIKPYVPDPPKPSKPMTLFQTILQEDNDTLWEIVKIFHPNAPDNHKHRMVVSVKYDWITVKLSYYATSNAIQVSLGIHNAQAFHISGGNKPIKVFEDALTNNEVSFRIWRFTDDTLYKEYTDEPFGEGPGDQDCCKEAVELLQSRGYDLQTAFEMYTIYHQD